MFIDKGNYFIIDEFERERVGTIFTDKNYGDVKTKLFLSDKKEENQERFLKEFEIEDKIFIYGSQTHSSNIVDIVDVEKRFFEDTDGYITKRRDVVIFTQYADCLPIYFYSKEKQVIGLCHSGWQGTYKEIAKNTIEKMVENYGCKIDEIIVGLGIGVGSCCYEVGDDFYKKFSEKFESDIVRKAFSKREDSWHFDNLEFTYNLLLNLGVQKIIRDTRCTYCDERFHSFRREKTASGRNGAFIYFKD